ncbi:MAG: hypothetical protein AAFV54_05030 [Pseudomonadota bacterium]
MLVILKFILIFIILLLILLILMRLWRGGGWWGGGQRRGPEPGDPGLARTLTDDAIDKATGNIGGETPTKQKVPATSEDDSKS